MKCQQRSGRFRGPPPALARRRRLGDTQQQFHHQVFPSCYDVIDASRQFWIEARYYWTHVDVAVQWQLNSRAPGSEYGALPALRTWQALLTYYF